MGLWTLTHLYNVIPAIIIYGIVAVFARKYFFNIDEDKKFIVLRAISVIILILELIKQITSAVGGYDLYSLPFHYCSLFLYLLPVHSFYRGKYRHSADAITLTCCASLLLFMLVMPAIVYSSEAIQGFSDNFSNMHTVVFHHAVLLYFFLAVGLGVFRFEPRRDMKTVATFLSVYVVIATVMSFAFETNFHNLYRCNVAAVEEIRLSLVDSIGWLGHGIYIAVLFVLTILFAYAAYFLVKAAAHLVDKVPTRSVK